MLVLADHMPTSLTWEDVAIRLLATVVAGAVIGVNRERGGHAAGLRTTVLVGVAACVSMIQANLLLSTSVATNGSMDILRLPLGVLTGVGFIGGGAILRRGDIATGVTTAATLWLITAVGLCFGGGQLVTGTIGTAVAIIILAPFKWLDLWLPIEQKGSVGVLIPESKVLPDIKDELPARVEACFVAIRLIDAQRREAVYELRWFARHGASIASDIVNALSREHELTHFEHRRTMT
ncbi:MgtC/SapB family protein [Rhizobium cauense]|nr:MgtC/SapB family protein [Rhizobium cauense]MBW9117999.1 MgtC/SapB family protein [Rhizobium cauense]